MATMTEIDKEIEAYKGMRQDLEAKHMGKWVLVYEGKLIGVHDSFEAVAEDAVAKYGRGPYLIWQVGAPPVTLPASVMYHPGHGRA